MEASGQYGSSTALETIIQQNLDSNQPSTTANPVETQRRNTTEQDVREVLVLRLAPAKKKKKKKGVQWAEDVVDNEFMNKKSSKKCCIFHRQRAFGDWSDDEDSDAECDECGKNDGDGGQDNPQPQQQQQ